MTIFLKLLKSNLLVLLIASSISACSITSINQDLVANNQQNIQNIDNYTASGSMAIFEKKTKLSSRFYVIKKLNNYELTLNGLTGSTIFRLEKNQNGTQITDQDGKIYFDKETNTLVKQLTGLSIPADILPNILKGDISNFSSYTTNEQGLPESAELNGFQIKYEQYQEYNSRLLPKRITILGTDLKIRININKWEL